MSKAVASPLFDPVVGVLVEKLADGGARIRDSASLGIEAVIDAPSLGPTVISAHALKPLNAKQKSSWRIILTRFELFMRVAQQFGMSGGSASGLSPEAIMNYIKNVNGFAHSNGEVRDAAKACSVAVYRVIGEDGMAPYLKDLRKKQLEEYKVAFKQADEDRGAAEPAARGKPTRGEKNEEESEGEVGKSRRVNEGSTRGGGGGSELSSQREGSSRPPSQGQGRKAENNARDATAQGGGRAEGPGHAPSPSTSGTGRDEFSTCMFCGAGDRSWNEDALDLHYWKDCPLLAPCPGCAQIVEITGMPEHQLDECEQKESYVPCELTGMGRALLS